MLQRSEMKNEEAELRIEREKMRMKQVQLILGHEGPEHVEMKMLRTPEDQMDMESQETNYVKAQ